MGGAGAAAGRGRRQGRGQGQAGTRRAPIERVSMGVGVYASDYLVNRPTRHLQYVTILTNSSPDSPHASHHGIRALPAGLGHPSRGHSLPQRRCGMCRSFCDFTPTKLFISLALHTGASRYVARLQKPAQRRRAWRGLTPKRPRAPCQPSTPRSSESHITLADCASCTSAKSSVG